MTDLFQSSTDEQLLAAAAFDGEAFGVFYDRYESQMLGFFVRATGRADLAADLTAEVFAAALSSAAKFDSSLGTARSWLFGIAHHELADTWRRGRVEDDVRRRLGMEPIALEDEALERIDLLRDSAALRLLEDLPEDQHLAVKGRVLDEREYEELAAELLCSESAVRKRVSRGLQRIRRGLEDVNESST